MQLTISGQGRQSFLRHVRSLGSCRILRPISGDMAALQLSLIGQGGGLKRGDVQSYDISLDQGSYVHMQPVAAELLLPDYQPRPAAQQKFSFTLGEQARLYWAAQPIIPFERSALRRTVDVSVATGAVVGLEEFVVAGRVAREEIFRSIHLDLQMRLYAASQLKHQERLYVHPDLQNEANWGGYTAYFTLWLYGSLLARMDEKLLSKDVFWGILPIESGYVLRALGSPMSLPPFIEKVRQTILPTFFS